VQDHPGYLMKGRRPNAEERRWLASICELGCIVCRKEFGLFTEASPHHIDGKTKPGAHLKTIPLCGRHHQIPGDGYKTRHANKTAFEKAYGTEYELLLEVVELLA